MYTPFQGALFLKAYFESRTPLIGSAAHRSDLEIEAVIEEAKTAIAGLGPAEEGGSSADLLAGSVRSLLAEGGPGAALPDFVRRYEVTKKIHRHYDPITRKGSGGHREMAPYLLLALGCALEARRGGTLKYLNCLLKLGDLLVSRRDSLKPEEAALARPALCLETALVRELMAVHGVPA
jgi:hypothetical protein